MATTPKRRASSHGSLLLFLFPQPSSAVLRQVFSKHTRHIFLQLLLFLGFVFLIFLFSGSASTDSKNVGFSATTSSAGKSQFSEIASGSIDSSQGSLPLPSPHGQILERPNLKVFSFGDLKSATKSFKSDTLLGEGGFGRVYKGWLDEKTLSPAKAGSGMVVAIKKLNPESTQGFQEWQVITLFSSLSLTFFFKSKD